jgi:hypothetical protein
MRKITVCLLIGIVPFLQSPTPVLAQVVESLDELKMDKFITFRSPGGVEYLVWQYNGSCSKGTEGTANNNKACNGAAFDGKARVAAKTSFATGAAEDVADYAAFLQSLPEDDSMCKRRVPKLKSLPGRGAEEKINIRVTEVWLYAFKRQNDEDYHLILGTSGDYETALEHGFYNSEISGYPAGSASSAAHQAIKKARDDFEAFFGITDCGKVCRSYVDFYLNPIKVEVTGSMFYDIDHCNHIAHPADYPVITAWEIHPIREIKFEQ